MNSTQKRTTFYLPAGIIILLTAVSYLFTFDAAATDNKAPAADTVYIIQLRKNNNVKVIESAKKDLLAKYPDKKLLTHYQPPVYTLSIGYFPTEAEAQEFKKLLEKDFPGCLVLPFEQKK
jgi:hypothetical protein